MQHELGIHGLFHVEHWRGKLLQSLNFKNKITGDGKADILDQYFDSTGTGYDWYVGLLDSTFTGPMFQSDTPVITGKEFTNYTEGPGERQLINFDPAEEESGYILRRNPTTAYCTFTIGAAVVNQGLNGVFVADVNTGVPDLIWCTAAFGNVDATPATITVNTGDVLKVQYTIRIAL